MKPYSQACENNKDPILTVLRTEFANSRRVLEIGSGTGQHAIHFAAALSWLDWQPSDVAENLTGIHSWLQESPSPNLHQAVLLDVTLADWPVQGCDACFSANTAHIMHWPQVEAMFAGLAHHLASTATIALYGPFRFASQQTAASNEVFDRWLRDVDPGRGIRDAEALDSLAAMAGFQRSAFHPLPANNGILVWRR